MSLAHVGVGYFAPVIIKCASAWQTFACCWLLVYANNKNFMLLSFSSWQDDSGRRLTMLGDFFRPHSFTTQKRHARLLGQHLLSWSTKKKLTVLSENWLNLLEASDEKGDDNVLIEKDANKIDQTSWHSLAQTALKVCQQEKKPVEQVLAMSGPKSLLVSEMCDSRHLVALGNVTIRMVNFFKSLGEAPTDEEDRQRRDEFIKGYADIDVPFPKLWDEVDRVKTEALAAAELVGSAARIMIQTRIDALSVYIELGKKFEEMYSESDEEPCTLAYFRAMEKAQEEALLQWTKWTQDLSALTRDLAFFSFLARHLCATNSENLDSKQVVVVVDNLVAISCLEFLPTLGFVCGGFSGSIERIAPNTLDVSIPPMEKKYLEQVFARAFEFELKTVLTCSNCGIAAIELSKCARCKIATYCQPACQKKHWKVHKSDCKTK